MSEARVLKQESLGDFDCWLEQPSSEVARVLATGELDLATAAGLERTLRDALARAQLVVLDLSGVSFCDSTGLHVLISSTKLARDERRRLAILPGSQQVQRLFSLTGVTEQLEIVEDPATIVEHP